MTRPQGLAAVEAEVEAEGHLRGTPGFAAALQRRQVERCQREKGVATCQDCGYFDYCETAKAYLVALRYQPAPVEAPMLVVQDRLPDALFPAELRRDARRGSGGPGSR